jgi:trehalose 6-phosphate phosphatase
LMLQTGIKSAFYIGDDDTDEDVFSLPNTRIFTVRVGRKVSSQAQYFISEQAEINPLLRTLLRHYRLSDSDAAPVAPRKNPHRGLA